MQRKLFWAILPWLAACSSLEVHTDYDGAVDFSRYQSYYWVRMPETRNPLMADRIVAEIDGQLAAKGWKKAAEAQADAAVIAHVTAREQERIDTLYNGMGPGWYGPRRGGAWVGTGGYATSTVSYYTVGTLIVDLADARTHAAIWHGMAEGTVDNDPVELQKKIREAAQKLFQGFPPVQAASRPSP